MQKFNVFNVKTFSMASLIFCSLTLHAQQIPSSMDRYQNSEPSQSNSQTTAISQSDSQKQFEIEKQRRLAEEQIAKTIISDAVTVIEETKKALTLIRSGKNQEAMSAIERATGKVNVLLARYPNTALLPIDFYINIIDTAPLSLDRIKEISNDVGQAVRNRDYPEGRYLLDALQSEISIETYTLPLGVYPAALKKAANLLGQRLNQESAAALQETLNSLVIIDQTIPIPIIGAKTLLVLAEEKYNDNREMASKLIEAARYELDRARDLGYVNKEDNEFASLSEAIKDIQKQINSNTSKPSFFRSLKDRLDAFLKKHFDKKKRSDDIQSKSEVQG